MRGWYVLPMLALVSAAPLPADDAGVVRAALARVGGEGRVRCVEPRPTGRPFDDLRRPLDDSPGFATDPAPARAARVRDLLAMVEWLDADGQAIDAASAKELKDATVVIILADPRPTPDEAVGELNGTDGGAAPLPPETPLPDGPAITPDLLAAGQRLTRTPGCVAVTLSTVARHGDLAIVDVGITGGMLSGSGERWAFRRDARGWRWIAGYRTWIS